MAKTESFAELRPLGGDKDTDLKATWVPTDEEQSRIRRISRRIDKMLQHRHPYEAEMQSNLNLYHGRSESFLDDRRDLAHVSPYAYIFIEAKTAEEVRASQDYVFTAVENSGDNWKVKLLMDVKKHKDRKVKAKSLKHRRTRMKNLMGVAIVRKGFRRTLRKVKERVIDEDADSGILFKYEERVVPMYDDLFEEIVSPFQFAVDPNATNMDNAEDCVHYHTEGWLSFQEAYGNDPRMKNIEHVHPGNNGNVVVAEYFNKLLDEWVIMAAGEANGPINTVSGRYVEIFSGPLPDDHKDLPFVSYHNSPSFLQELSNTAGYYRSPTSGNDVIGSGGPQLQETFWTRGDPGVMRDLIDLRTGFGRAMFRAAKMAGETIIATAGNFKFSEKKQWRSGDQAVGAMGKYEVTPLGSTNTPNFQFVFDTLFEQMVMVAGVDPRSLTESKTKTATEASIQRETAMRRLMENIEYNEENGAVRDGRLDLSNFQQYYTIPKLARLRGDETKQELSQFHDLVEDPKSGVPIFGKTFRSIASSKKLKEYKRYGKYYLKETSDDSGVSAFLARPDYIRSSEIDVAVQTGRNASQIQAIEIEQASRGLELVGNLLPLTQAAPGEEPILTREDLPDIKSISKKFMDAFDLESSGERPATVEPPTSYRPTQLDAKEEAAVI
jgi:hypothetical protein